MKSKLGDDARLKHMLECMEEIESAIKNVDYEAFIKSCFENCRSQMDRNNRGSFDLYFRRIEK